MSLPLPIYLLGSSYYLHTRIGGKQIKRSLRTSYRRLAIIRAITLLDSLMRKDLPQKYELDLSRGILKANDEALLRKAYLERHDPSPGRTYATATVTGRPSWLNRLSTATRMCSSVT